MKTNEELKKVLVEQITEEIEELFEHLEPVEEGAFQQVEALILQAAMSIGRNWLEQMLNAPGEATQAHARREGACGHRQRLVGIREKTVLTVMGKVTVRRPYYHCMKQEKEEKEQETSAGHHGNAPFDTIWGIEQGRTSPGVQKIVSYFGASQTLSEISEALELVVPFSLSARQILHLIQPVGEALRREEEEAVEIMKQEAAQKRSQAIPKEKHQETKKRRWYVELDGVMARIRRGSSEMVRDEKERGGDVYREIKVGAVFEGKPGRNRSDLVPGIFVDEARPITYVARQTTAEAFGYVFYHLAFSCGIEEGDEIVVLGDGAVWIWNIAQEHFPQAVHIVDIWHAREHLWKIANAVYGSGKPETAVWANQACEWLNEGAIEKLLQEIEALPPLAPAAGASRSVPEIEADYFRTNAARMRYPTFRAKGMHLGSGIAEAACKTVVSTRAKRSGMRWTPQGLDAILALRTTVLNKTYKTFWQPRHHLIA
jgi:hypothetical protein